MDPVIASKIQFTRSVSDLEQIIPREIIYKELGGPEDWEYKFIEPEQNENNRMGDTATRTALEDERQNIVKELLTSTSSWISATATKDNEQIKTSKSRRAELIEKLRVNHWKLDPYVRSRNALDREGVIQEGGNIDFHPKANSMPEKKVEVEQHETVPANGVKA